MAEDRKFKIVDGRLVNRVSGEPIPDNEPIIIFRARDRHALDLLVYYRSLISDDHHRNAIQDRIEEFARFKLDNPDVMKEPGITRHIVLNSEQPYCSICLAPQYETPSGISCSSGHGGAESVYFACD